MYYQAVNSGGHTAEAVQMAYLPPHSSRAGVLVFSTDPAGGALRVSAVGYRLP